MATRMRFMRQISGQESLKTPFDSRSIAGVAIVLSGHPRRDLMATLKATAPRQPQLRSVSATINYTRPRPERLYTDVRDFSRTNMQFEPYTMTIQIACWCGRNPARRCT